MNLGIIIWCTITVTISIMGEPVKDYETAAKGRITKIEGDYLHVDFSEYARKQEYIGSYYDVKVNKADCVKDQ